MIISRIDNATTASPFLAIRDSGPTSTWIIWQNAKNRDLMGFFSPPAVATQAPCSDLENILWGGAILPLSQALDGKKQVPLTQ